MTFTTHKERRQDMSTPPQDEPVTTANLLRHIDEDWQALQSWLASLSDAQLAQMTDAQGWTVKDHMLHLARWETALLGMLNRQSKRETMDIDEQTWAAGDDSINAVLRQRYSGLSFAEAHAMANDIHAQVVAKITAMSDADVLRPHHDFQPGSENDAPIWNWIIGDTFLHYREHQEWMQAITTQG
jgi:hypothetical protein